MHTHTLQNILKNLTSYLICVSAVKFLSKTEFLKALGLNGYMPVAFTGAMQFDGVRVRYAFVSINQQMFLLQHLCKCTHTHLLATASLARRVRIKFN